MSDALTTFVPLFGFMLIPVWIPLLAETVGRVVDLLGSRRHDELASRIAALKERSHAKRTAQPEVRLADAA